MLLNPNVLDITNAKVKGEELKKEIEYAVKQTQSVVIRELPNQILMTQEQYDDLKPGFSMQEFAGQEYYLYRTKLNIMEIEVKK
jgi:predicted RNA-binding protein